MSWLLASGGQGIGVSASASASVLPMNISGLISFRIDWLDLLAVPETLKFSPAPQNGSELFILLNLFLQTRSLLSNWMVKGLS